jgi:hypothetical protein
VFVTPIVSDAPGALLSAALFSRRHCAEPHGDEIVEAGTHWTLLLFRPGSDG